MNDDPIAACRFQVTLQAGDAYLPKAFRGLLPMLSEAGFQEVSGLGAELEVLAHPEGGRNDFVHQLPVRHSWGRIVLKRGLARMAPVLWEWYEASLLGALNARRDGSIYLCDPAGNPIISWDFRAGLAVKWTGPEFSAINATVAIETLEIAHQGLSQRHLDE